jgi:hypothetical protein
MDMSNEYLPVFRPTSTVSINANTITASIALAGSGRNVRVSNSGLTAVFLAFGGSTVTATVATGLPIQPGTSEVFDYSGANTYVAAITESGTSRISVTRGDGG